MKKKRTVKKQRNKYLTAAGFKRKYGWYEKTIEFGVGRIEVRFTDDQAKSIVSWPSLAERLSIVSFEAGKQQGEFRTHSLEEQLSGLKAMKESMRRILG